MSLPANQCEEDQTKIPILIILATVGYYATGWYEKIPCRTSSLSGDRYITELLLQKHPRRVQEVMRMSLSTLRQLENFCLKNTKLQSSRGVGLSEKLATFIDVLGHGGRIERCRKFSTFWIDSEPLFSRIFDSNINSTCEIHTSVSAIGSSLQYYSRQSEI